MQERLILTIAVSCFASLACMGGAHAATEVLAHAPKTDTSHGGKCASGKCGLEKIYSKAPIKQDRNGHLVRARDGQCGLSGKGYAVPVSEKERLAEGVCGQ